jgi:TonB family protein
MTMARQSGALFAQAADLNEPAVLNNVYPVLIEQKDEEEIQTERIRALSHKNVEGRGGMTEKEGFHTLSSYDTLSAGHPGMDVNQPADADQQSDRKDKESAEKTSRNEENGTGRQADARYMKQGNSGRMTDSEFKIPANYRFREDFRFRFDERGGIAVPTQEMAGFKYFRDMLRRIRETFAPPGLNYAYRDYAGTVISQPIKPQVVKVLFSIDYNGEVRDVRVVSSMGQNAVDRACIDVLDGKNFGAPPPEIFADGHIFGINFIFPSVTSQ